MSLLYHGTTSMFLDSINNIGLLMHAPVHNHLFRGFPGVYLSYNYETALNYAEHAVTNNRTEYVEYNEVIITIDSDLSNFSIDEDFLPAFVFPKPFSLNKIDIDEKTAFYMQQLEIDIKNIECYDTIYRIIENISMHYHKGGKYLNHFDIIENNYIDINKILSNTGHLVQKKDISCVRFIGDIGFHGATKIISIDSI